MRHALRATCSAAVILLPLALCGCDSFSQALGMERIVPDEKSVTTNQPLSIPPDYNLKPPRESPKGSDDDSDTPKPKPVKPLEPPVINGDGSTSRTDPVTVP